MALKVPAKKAAEIAISSIGLGYDVANDISLKYCKRDSQDPCLLELDKHSVQDIVLPGGLCIPNVTRSIKCDKGERMRFRSDVLPFQQMCEQFNQEISLSGKIPSGYFNNVFGFSGSWQKDASATKALAFDGWFITLYTVALSNSQIVLRDHIKQAVPSTWDPAALTRFIERYGTHVIIGLKMGGKDVIYIRQQHASTLEPIEVQKKLKELADKRFLDGIGHYDTAPKEMRGVEKFEGREQRLRFAESSPSSSYSGKEDIVKIFKRRGGRDNKELSHIDWLESIQSEPDVISMSFLPITSLLNGVPGSGFLSHAINLYLRYKPPIEELHHFLEFQLPRQWAPVYSDLPLGPQRKQRSSSASLQFTFLGPKLFVNTSLVDAGKKPVTGIRLYLEGKRSNKLAIHLQHLCSLPQILHLQEDPPFQPRESYDPKWFEPVQWRHFSHVCTAPVEVDDDLSIVTGAQLHVGYHGLKKVLFLRLKFSSVSNAALFRNPEWEGSPNLGQKSGLISTLISTHFSFVAQKPTPRPPDVNINSAVYPGGPPVPVQTPKMLKYVDTTEMLRGPQDSPGYWVVSGAKLHLERGKITLRVKYSLLTVMLPDDELQ